MMKKLGDFNVGDILIRYYTQREWAMYIVTDKKGESSKRRGMWKPIAISDMTVDEWKLEARSKHDMYFFDFESRSIEDGTIINVSENLEDPGIRRAAHQSIKKILEGKA